MPATSKAQQKAAGAALAAKRGDTPTSRLKGASRSMADSMTEARLRELAATLRKGKPERKGDNGSQGSRDHLPPGSGVANCSLALP
ncbi:DUF3008 family protein [Brevundimonas sp.]|uniref:DUF3008 family protein n=1 Tax=Brevundimonas sp. TaxID=1871086 RepID=UPI0034506919